MGAPVILAHSILPAATLSCSSTAPGFELQHIADTRTYTWWGAAYSGTSIINISCSSAQAADCLGIIGHNLYSGGITVALDRSDDGVNWTAVIAAFTPASDRALLKRFTEDTALHWRLVLVGATLPMLAVVSLGQCLQFPFPPESPFTPKTVKTEQDTQISKVGNPLGTVISHYAVTVEPEFKHVARSWALEAFGPFWQAYGRTRALHFWGWDLDTYPDDVLYLRQVGDYKAPVSTMGYVDSLKLKMEGVEE